jgi:putative tryptophan/tyrosine transport system substrate-binding protein
MKFGTLDSQQKRRAPSFPLLAAALLVASLGSAFAQTTERLPKVGYLGFGAAVPPTPFQNRLSELGYTEGKRVVVEYRFAGGRPGSSPLGPRTGRR